MARIFITGSADGLGQMAAQCLVDLRHVVLHARNACAETIGSAGNNSLTPRSIGIMPRSIGIMASKRC